MNLNEICHVDIPEGESGIWSVSKFEIKSDTIGTLHYALHGRPIPNGNYTRLMHDNCISMSDTPAEMNDHYEMFYEAKNRGGKILINGLGIGAISKGLLTLPQIESIDIVELNEDVIKLVAPYYLDPRIKIHHHDALTMKWPKGSHWNVVWHDIWDNICSDNLEQMFKLHRKYGRLCDWQGSWCKDECLRQRGTGR